MNIYVTATVRVEVTDRYLRKRFVTNEIMVKSTVIIN